MGGTVGEEFIFVRKIGRNNNARIVVLPSAWIKYVTAKYYKEPQYVVMKISGTRIVIEPTYDEALIEKLSYRGLKKKKTTLW